MNFKAVYVVAPKLLICCVNLLQDHAGRTPLQCAAYGGYITCMAVLMENHADPNIQDKEVRNCLYLLEYTFMSDFFL